MTRENLSACKAFVDFWDDHVIIPRVRVFYRHPSLQKKPLMVMCPCLTTSTFSKSIWWWWCSWTWYASLEVWSNIRTAFLCSEIPHMSKKSVSSVLFRSGHSIQNHIDCNWFCTLFQMKDGRFHPAVWVQEKDCWWFSVAGRKLANFVALARDQFFRRHPYCTEVLHNHSW